MIVAKNGNNRGWRTVQTVLLILSLGFLFMDKIVMPQVNSGKLADTVYVQGKQIAVLEDLAVSLRSLPTDVAGLKARMDGVKETVDWLKKKMDGDNKSGR